MKVVKVRETRCGWEETKKSVIINKPPIGDDLIIHSKNLNWLCNFIKQQSNSGTGLLLIPLLFIRINKSAMMVTGQDDGTDSSEYSYIRRHHKHELRDNQCSSSLIKHIKAPVHLVSSRICFNSSSFYLDLSSCFL